MNLTRILNLFLILLLMPLVFSAEVCYQCVSAMDSECKETLKENFPNQCLNRDPGAKCVVYEYKAPGEEMTHIVRGCKSVTDNCANIKDSLRLQHKEVKNCNFCKTDLCNKSIPRKEKPHKSDDTGKHTNNNGSVYGFIFSGHLLFSIIPKCLVKLLFVIL